MLIQFDTEDADKEDTPTKRMTVSVRSKCYSIAFDEIPAAHGSAYCTLAAGKAAM
jgi:hypothetical protein